MTLIDVKKLTFSDYVLILGTVFTILSYVWFVSAEMQKTTNKIDNTANSLIEHKEEIKVKIIEIKSEFNEYGKDQKEIKEMLHSIDKKMEQTATDIKWLKQKETPK